ncbi:MAG TPA: polysaccharide deacetylase family protein [Acidimicrobiales bacterium]|nr:polysaccharide deacetylase family protein [Acidimicrobiales bacterium]
MRHAVCVTVDVEDFYDGMAVLGQQVERRPDGAPGLGALLRRLEAQPTKPKVTLFVVGNHAPAVAEDLRAFAQAGHEIASHGPDHGRLPDRDLVGWLRRGRAVLEDLLGIPVRGFRSPRFDLPAAGLTRYRDALAEAGYHYVSDATRLGTRSPVREMPVLSWRGLRVGGGSYQRLLPFGVVASTAQRAPGPAVLYYHSYDFDGTLPGLGAVRSPLLARQIVGRHRIAPLVWRLTARFGSETCAHAAL